MASKRDLMYFVEVQYIHRTLHKGQSMTYCVIGRERNMCSEGNDLIRNVKFVFASLY